MLKWFRGLDFCMQCLTLSVVILMVEFVVGVITVSPPAIIVAGVITWIVLIATLELDERKEKA